MNGSYYNNNSYHTLIFQCSICSRLDKDYPKELFSKETLLSLNKSIRGEA